ncbi:hypothetical protein [Candidatus Magnetominusculus xianensis]|uniref:Uncharacterized protein n=1 Tax=Candidatus Magnetominusculus xianensis TaxID=1748249 RepID=A0ABR5SCY0_9BACT|nr:hypothetical protein [Candidatus Magnetominusculus xianensis]KWT77344.1 hypothetical protein ASN18_3039 [Candidatus Magnetominusculus xianensis]MBF0404973.1 hypothetical protein [Nitrospirota bacterium]
MTDKATMTVTFSATCDSSSSQGFTFESDSDKNGGKSSFMAVDDTAWYRLTPGGKTPTLWSNLGSVSNSGSVSESISEYITVNKSKTATLSKTPYGSVTYTWIGAYKGDDTPKFSGTDITFSKSTTGVLKCEYEALYDLLEISTSTSGMLLVTAETSDRAGYTTIDYTGTSTTRKVYLTVKDACSKAVLEAVSVHMRKSASEEWVYIGVTNTSGQLYLGELVTGKKYKLKLVKSGYYDSDKDSIKNDEFTVSSEETKK